MYLIEHPTIQIATLVDSIVKQLIALRIFGVQKCGMLAEDAKQLINADWKRNIIWAKHNSKVHHIFEKEDDKGTFVVCESAKDVNMITNYQEIADEMNEIAWK